MEQVNIVKMINKFSIKEAIIKRKDWVKYKTIPDWHGKVIGDNIIAGDPGKAFQNTVVKYVNEYLFSKKVPPAAIATAIINIADDYLNERDTIVRAGDYIAIQNFIRSGK